MSLEQPTMPQSDRVHRLLAYWSGKRRGRAMPQRREIDPAEIGDLLPFVALADVSADPLRVRFRLAGEAICDSYGCNLAGRWLDELRPPGGVAAWLAAHARLVGGRVPVLGRLRASSLAGEHVVAWALLPLSSDGDSVDKCVQIEDWHMLYRVPRAERHAASWELEFWG